jgi:hypothetical protein
MTCVCIGPDFDRYDMFHDMFVGTGHDMFHVMFVYHSPVLAHYTLTISCIIHRDSRCTALDDMFHDVFVQ